MKKVTDIKGKLLEGCIWDEQRERLYFVDIEYRKIYMLEKGTENLQSMEVPEFVGCIVLQRDGSLIAALTKGLCYIDFDERVCRRVMNGILKEGIRFNDGKCDEQGRLWVGSMAVLQDEYAERAGSLYCIEKERVQGVYPGYSIPNGIDFDGKMEYLYHIDTAKKQIERYQMGEDGTLKNRKTVADLRREPGDPDGMCMDAEGNLWAAMWGGSQVVCIEPGSGKILDRIQVPEKYPSCCVFGGKEMDQLFITTARDEMGNGGEVYVHEMNVKGRSANRYGK